MTDDSHWTSWRANHFATAMSASPAKNMAKPNNGKYHASGALARARPAARAAHSKQNPSQKHMNALANGCMVKRPTSVTREETSNRPMKNGLNEFRTNGMERCKETLDALTFPRATWCVRLPNRDWVVAARKRRTDSSSGNTLSNRAGTELNNRPVSQPSIGVGSSVEVSGGLKAAKQALARPLDRLVRLERTSKPRCDPRGCGAVTRGGQFLFTRECGGAQPAATRGSSLGLSAPERRDSSSARQPARSAQREARRACEPVTEQCSTTSARQSAPRRPAGALRGIGSQKGPNVEVSGCRRQSARPPG